MMKRLSLKKNFSWNFISNLIFAITQWGILSVIAKYGTPSMVGQFSLGLAVTAPIILLTNMQLRAIQATDAKDTYDMSEYLGLRVITSILAIVITCVAILIIGYDPVTSIVILLVGISKLIDGLSDVIHGFFHRQERMDYSSKSKILKGILTILVVGVSFIVTSSLMISLLVMCATYIIVFVFYDIRQLKLFRSFTITFNKVKMFNLFKLAYPLGIVLMLSSLYSNIPRLFLEKYDGLESLGYFAAIAYILIAGNTFIGGVGQAVSPRLASVYAEKKYTEFKKLLIKSLLIGITIGVVFFTTAVLIGDRILIILYTEEYAQYQYTFVVLAASTIISFSSSFLGYGITATRSFKMQPILAMGWTISSIILSIYLVPRYYINGAAYTILISSLIQLALQYVYLHNKLAKAKENKTL